MHRAQPLCSSRSLSLLLPVEGLKLNKFVSAAPYGVPGPRHSPPSGPGRRRGPLGVRPSGGGSQQPHTGRPTARAAWGLFTAHGCLKLNNLFLFYFLAYIFHLSLLQALALSSGMIGIITAAVEPLKLHCAALRAQSKAATAPTVRCRAHTCKRRLIQAASDSLPSSKNPALGFIDTLSMTHKT